MHQISSPREQVGVNQHGPLPFGREEIVMWLPQGSEEADPWSSSLGISNAPQGRGSGVHGGGRGCVLLALLRGNESLGCLTCLSPCQEPPLPVARARGWKLCGSAGASARVDAMRSSKRTTEGIYNSSTLTLFPFETDNLSYVHLQFSNPLLYPYLGKNTIFIVAISLHQ